MTGPPILPSPSPLHCPPLLPAHSQLVLDWMEEAPGGRVCFTGAGLGGSLAAAVALMAVARGLQRGALAPVYAFNAPAIIAGDCCERSSVTVRGVFILLRGSACAHACMLACRRAHTGGGGSGSGRA